MLRPIGKVQMELRLLVCQLKGSFQLLNLCFIIVFFTITSIEHYNIVLIKSQRSIMSLVCHL